MGSLPLAPPGKPICLSSHPQSLYLYLSCYTPISVEYLSSFYSSIHHTTRYTRTHTPTPQSLSVSAPLSSRPAYPLHLLKPSMDSPRSPAPFLLPPGEPPTWLFWLCPLCAGPTAIEGLGLPLKELLLGALSCLSTSQRSSTPSHVTSPTGSSRWPSTPTPGGGVVYLQKLKG